MAVADFLRHLRSQPASQTRFLDRVRRDALARLFYQHPGLSRHAVEDAIGLALVDLVEGKIGAGFVGPEGPQTPAYADALARYLATQIVPRKLVDLYRVDQRGGPKLSVEQLCETPEGESWLEREIARQGKHPGPPALEEQQDLRRLQTCLEQLSPPLRAVVDGRLADESQAQTAARLHLSKVETVKSRMFSAIKKLQQCMSSQAHAAGARA